MNSKISAVLKALALIFSLGLVICGSSAISAAAIRTVGNASSLPCTGTYSTISAAVAAALPGDTIQVCQGTYPELVAVNKTLTILGNQAGVDARTRVVPITSESVVGSGDGAFQIEADKVVIDGFTIQGVTNNPSAPPFTGLGAGIWTNPGFSGTQGGHQLRNNIIQNNIVGIYLNNTGTFPANVDHNLIQNNNFPGPASGSGIYSDLGIDKVTIDRNKFAGNINDGIVIIGFGTTASNLTMSNNELAANGGAIALLEVTSSAIATNNIHNSTGSGADVDIFGGVNGLSVTCNNLASGAGRGIQVENPYAGYGVSPNANVTINNNNISGYPVGLEEDTGGYTPVAPNSLNATFNWWGSSTGPTIASNPTGTGEPIIDMEGVVKYSPFLTTFSSCAPVPQVGPPTNKDQCKNGGWMNFNVPRKFKNQGDCVSYTSNGK